MENIDEQEHESAELHCCSKCLQIIVLASFANYLSTKIPALTADDMVNIDLRMKDQLQQYQSAHLYLNKITEDIHEFLSHSFRKGLSFKTVAKVLLKS